MSTYLIEFKLLMLIAGIILTVITIRRMVAGQISLPGWGKALLTAAMVILLLITLLSMLPPIEVHVTNPFVETNVNVVTPADPSETAAPN